MIRTVARRSLLAAAILSGVPRTKANAATDGSGPIEGVGKSTAYV
jgi:hypothetical protein